MTVMPVGDGDNVDENTPARITATGLATASVNVSIDDTTQILTFGWPTYFGQFVQYENFILHAYKFTVTGTSPVTLDRWGVLSSGGGSTMARIAIYSNGTSGPGNLVASSGPFAITATELDVPDTVVLSPGTYWLALQVSASVGLAEASTATAADAYCNRMISFATALPTTWGAATCFPHYNTNVYIVAYR